MNKNFATEIDRTKKRFHKNMAKMCFEEKVKIIIELQKLHAEMHKKNKRTNGIKYRIWDIKT